MNMTIWWAALLGYVLGAIPFGLLLTRMAGAGDLRSIGSGNIGATNVLRTGRKGLAAATLLLDLLKGLAAVLIARALFPAEPQLAAQAAAAGAFIGHLYPVWLRFDGGKGIATTAGVVVGLAPMPLGICIGAWIVFFAVSRYVSVASIAAAVALPLSVALLPGERFGLLFWIFLFLGVMAIWKHRGNIKRLMDGTEPRAWGGKKEAMN